nr:organomercurial lyase [Streptomyces boncukensis]
MFADGSIRAAYPFSGPPTAHRVAVAGRGSPYAMCAIDALGVSAMLGGVPVSVSAHEPGTRRSVSVRVAGRTARWRPATAAVLLGAVTGGSCRAYCESVCSYVNFFTRPAAAREWAAAHPRVDGPVVDGGQALDLAVACFGDVLRPAGG